MNLREWLNAGRPAPDPERRPTTLPETFPSAFRGSCVVCRKPLPVVTRVLNGSTVTEREAYTCCSFRCALEIVEREGL